ncbi:MAG: universal stress protein [Brevundimonas sp.]|uniref:universal stress protein n=1 Tax=Brevundimonas sp. TaxID=1871086 RepID=UPI002733D79F|nr:universal stress protein [Brevundimonas sp.]MDP3405168.1 universal stress protein [Brevundimonas sp.]
MSLRDILLQIDTYPDPTSSEAIDQAVRFAASMGGTLSAVAVEVMIKAPNNRLANYLIGLGQLAREEEQKSRQFCVTALEDFRVRAGAAGVLGDVIHLRDDVYDVGATVAQRARTRDLCLVPVLDQYDGQRAVIEAVVFGAGRPVLTYRPGIADLPGAGPDLVVLAWDGTRTSARAMAGSLGVLQKARKVRVLTVTGEKPTATAGLGEDAQRHLVAHGVNAVVDEVDAGGRAIGRVFDDYLERQGADLFVMGAYGRSRAREFILGGATEHMLKAPKVPLMLSH